MVHPHGAVFLYPNIPRSGDPPRKRRRARASGGGRGGSPPAPLLLRQRPAALVTHRPSLLLVDGLTVKPQDVLQRQAVLGGLVGRIHGVVAPLLLPVSSIRQPRLVPAEALGHPFILSAQEARWREQVQGRRTRRHGCFPLLGGGHTGAGSPQESRMSLGHEAVRGDYCLLLRARVCARCVRVSHISTEQSRRTPLSHDS